MKSAVIQSSQFELIRTTWYFYILSENLLCSRLFVKCNFIIFSILFNHSFLYGNVWFDVEQFGIIQRTI